MNTLIANRTPSRSCLANEGHLTIASRSPWRAATRAPGRAWTARPYRDRAAAGNEGSAFRHGGGRVDELVHVHPSVEPAGLAALPQLAADLVGPGSRVPAGRTTRHLPTRRRGVFRREKASLRLRIASSPPSCRRRRTASGSSPSTSHTRRKEHADVRSLLSSQRFVCRSTPPASAVPGAAVLK